MSAVPERPAYATFTSKRMPWHRTLPNGTILLSDDEGQPLLALTPAAAEDLAFLLTRHAGYIRADAAPQNAPSPSSNNAGE